MHENLQVTDGVYGIFSNVDVQKSIANLGKSSYSNSLEIKEIIEVLEKTAKNLKSY